MYFHRVHRQRKIIMTELEQLGCSPQQAKFGAKNARSSIKEPWYVKSYEACKITAKKLFRRLTGRDKLDYQLIEDLYKKGLLYISPNSPVLRQMKKAQ